MIRIISARKATEPEQKIHEAFLYSSNIIIIVHQRNWCIFMFEFFRDMYYETRSIDKRNPQNSKREKREAGQRSRFIFSRKTELTVYIIGGIYILIAIYSIVTTAMHDGHFVNELRYILPMTIDITVCVCLIIGSKKMEIAALAVCVIFIALIYGSILGL